MDLVAMTGRSDVYLLNDPRITNSTLIVIMNSG